MSDYHYRVYYSPDSPADEAYIGVCVEFGDGLSHVDDDPDKALAGIRDLVPAAVQALRNRGRPVPPPMPDAVDSTSPITITLRGDG